MTSLSWLDYVILFVFLSISLGIGVYHSLSGGRQRTTEEFIMANRHLKMIPTAMSLLVSFQSAIMMLGSTAEMYLYGVGYMVMAPLSIGIGVVVAERVFVPWIYRLKVVSINEVLEQRFRSKTVRIFGSSLSIIVGLTYMGTAMYAPAAALEAVVGFPVMLSIPLMAAICVGYTTLGGMRAVIWTDVFQFCVMMGGLMAILIKGLLVVGGIGEVFRCAGDVGRLQWFDWSLDPTVRHTVWGFLFGYAPMWVFAYGLTQAAAQRYSSTSSLKEARITVLLNVPALFFIYFTVSVLGLTAVAYYSKLQCDPLANNEIGSANQLLPHFVNTIFANAKGFSGLFLATLYGGALSSVSSALSGSAANCWEDILKWKLNDVVSESTKAIINRALVVTFGFISTGIAFLAAAIPGPITQVAIALGGSIGGPLCGLFVLGGMSRHGNWQGALIGGTTSLVLNLWLNIGSMRLPGKHPALPHLSVDGCANNENITAVTRALNVTLDVTSYNSSDVQPLHDVVLTGIDRLYSLSYIWYVLLGVVVAITVGLIASLFFRDKAAESEIDERLLFRFRDLFCGFSDGGDEIQQQQQQQLDEKHSLPEIQPLSSKPNDWSDVNDNISTQDNHLHPHHHVRRRSSLDIVNVTVNAHLFN